MNIGVDINHGMSGKYATVKLLLGSTCIDLGDGQSLNPNGLDAIADAFEKIAKDIRMESEYLSANNSYHRQVKESHFFFNR